MNRTILVTGGNRGIGLAAVAELAREPSHRVLLGCRSLAQGQEAAKDLPANVEAVLIRLSRPEELSEDIENLLRAHPSIDGLINNAGVLHEGDLSSTSPEDLSDAVQVNTIAPITLIRAVLPSMRQNGYGRIVNVSSEWGSFADGLQGPFSYSVTKAALNAVTMTAARELSGDIKINSVCPGWVHTRMGGKEAPRTPEEGAATITWLATLPKDGPSGLFFRDRQPIAW